MIDPIFQSENYHLARNLLDAAVLRHEALAANIANSDTPGYRRLDLAPDFARQLQSRVAAGEIVTAGPIRPRLVEDASARSLRPDGNTVELEGELLELNRNALEHEFLSDIVSSNLKQLRMAITGRPQV